MTWMLIALSVKEELRNVSVVHLHSVSVLFSSHLSFFGWVQYGPKCFAVQVLVLYCNFGTLFINALIFFLSAPDISV